MNSCEALPPMAPESASTTVKSSPHRSKIRRYAPSCARYDLSSPSVSASKEYPSYMRNSRPRMSPNGSDLVAELRQLVA